MLDMIFSTENWKMERKYVIRRRVFFTLLALAFLVLAWTIGTQIWWVGDGYCFGSLEKCFPQEFGGK